MIFFSNNLKASFLKSISADFKSETLTKQDSILNFIFKSYWQ